MGCKVKLYNYNTCRNRSQWGAARPTPRLTHSRVHSSPQTCLTQRGLALCLPPRSPIPNPGPCPPQTRCSPPQAPTLPAAPAARADILFCWPGSAAPHRLRPNIPDGRGSVGASYPPAAVPQSLRARSPVPAAVPQSLRARCPVPAAVPQLLRARCPGGDGSEQQQGPGPARLLATMVSDRTTGQPGAAGTPPSNQQPSLASRTRPSRLPPPITLQSACQPAPHRYIYPCLISTKSMPLWSMQGPPPTQ